MPVEVVNVASRLESFSERWSPKIAGEVNDLHVKLVKLEGEFIWHHHDTEDELFFVLRGLLRMRIRDEQGERELKIAPGEFVVIPRGMEHMPIADEEVHCMLLEPKSTLNTGNVRNERTRENLERI